MTTRQFAAMVEFLNIDKGSEVVILCSDSHHPQRATVTRMATDKTWFNADVLSGASAGGMTWTNGKRINTETVACISKA